MNLYESDHLKSKRKQRQGIIVYFGATLLALCIASVSLADNGKGGRKVN
jgi:hypothetical protein